MINNTLNSLFNELQLGKRVKRSSWDGSKEYLFLVNKELISRIPELADELPEALLNDGLIVKSLNGELTRVIPTLRDLLSNDWVLAEEE